MAKREEKKQPPKVEAVQDEPTVAQAVMVMASAVSRLADAVLEVTEVMKQQKPAKTPPVDPGVIAQGGTEYREKKAPEYKKPNPCTGCGIDLNDPAQKHSAACEVENARLGVKSNGKKVNPEEMAEEMKTLVVKLAQSAGREAVVAILTEFGVQKASEIPIARLPEFNAALKGAVAKAS